MLRLTAIALAMFVVLGRADAAPTFAPSRLFAQALDLFNRGNYRHAYPQFTALVAAHYDDPRAYYYRGLCAWQLGAREAAEADFRAGAQLEVQLGDALGLTSIQIYRIQGRARLVLEEHRASARLAAYERREQERWQRFSGGDPGSTPAANVSPSGAPPAASAPATVSPPTDPFAPKTP